MTADPSEYQTVTAAVADAAQSPFQLREVLLDPPRSEELIVRVAGVGICHTDIIARDRVIPTPLPAVFGHEASGIVERVGSAVDDLKPGDQVVLTFLSCGECSTCMSGQPAYCAQMPLLNFSGRRADGSSALSANGGELSGHFFGQSSFATFALAHRRNAIKVETSALPLELLGPLGCGVQTGAGAVMRVLNSGPGSSILIFGGGPVGLSAVIAAAARGCRRILLVEPHAVRRQLAVELGATDVLDPTLEGDNLLPRIHAIEPAGFNHVIDATGIPSVIETAVGATAKLGTCILIGAPSRPGETAPLRFGTFVQNGITLRGVIEGDSEPHSFIPELLALQAKGLFPFERMVRLYDFADINQAIEDQKAGRCVKAVLRMPSIA